MVITSVFDAKTNLSKYISAILNKQEPFVIIARNGKPVAKLVPYQENPVKIGAGKNIIPTMPTVQEFNDIDVISDFAAEDALL